MTKFKITVDESITYVYVVEADNLDDAFEKLDNDDYESVDKYFGETYTRDVKEIN